MDDITVTKMTADDVTEVAELDKKCFALAWSEQSFQEEMQNKLAVYFTAKKDGGCIGYAGFWNIAGEGGITNIAVLPDYRRKGVGTALVSALVREARELGLDLLTLEVRKSNFAAQGLYKSFGFDIIGERKRYYRDNGEDAFIMTKRLKSEEVL